MTGSSPQSAWDGHGLGLPMAGAGLLGRWSQGTRRYLIPITPHFLSANFSKAQTDTSK